jgi:hypothetical protein
MLGLTRLSTYNGPVTWSLLGLAVHALQCVEAEAAAEATPPEVTLRHLDFEDAATVLAAAQGILLSPEQLRKVAQHMARRFQETGMAEALLAIRAARQPGGGGPELGGEAQPAKRQRSSGAAAVPAAAKRHALGDQPVAATHEAAPQGAQGEAVRV